MARTLRDLENWSIVPAPLPYDPQPWRMKGLQTKRPLTLGWQGALAGGFMVVILTRGHWISALEAGDAP
jgi:hypothetical protein